MNGYRAQPEVINAAIEAASSVQAMAHRTPRAYWLAIVEAVLQAANHQGAVDRIAELERELDQWRYCRECGSKNVTLDECADCGLTADGGRYDRT